jgi:hypothetical protein
MLINCLKAEVPLLDSYYIGVCPVEALVLLVLIEELSVYPIRIITLIKPYSLYEVVRVHQYQVKVILRVR